MIDFYFSDERHKQSNKTWRSRCRIGCWIIPGKL